VKTALIDADIIAYTESAMQKREDPFGDSDLAESKCVDLCGPSALQTVKNWAAEAGCERILLVFSPPDGSNFRKALDPTYKAHRKSVKPPAYNNLVAFMKIHHEWMHIHNLEGDDVLGILSTDDTVIVSTDKDMQTIPNTWLYNPNKMVEPIWTSLAHADHYWMTQTITGDPTDGYKGAYLAGPKTAEKALVFGSSLGVLWDCVLDVYNAQQEKARDRQLSKGLVVETAFQAALRNARMARILRPGDYNLAANRRRLWHPTDPVWVDDNLSVVAL